VHQRVDILQAFLVNDTRRKIYCKNTLRSQRVNTLKFLHIPHLNMPCILHLNYFSFQV